MEIQAIFTKIDRRDDMTIADLQQYTDWALSTRKHGRGNGEVMHTLRDYRRRAVDASDSMVAAAEREARGLLASEQRAVDKHGERVTAIDQLIDRLEREDRENPPYSVTGAPAIMRAAGGRQRFDVDRHGNVLLRSTDRVADYVAQQEGHEQHDRASFGELVRAIVTGDKSNLSDYEARAMGASTLTLRTTHALRQGARPAAGADRVLATS